MPRVTALIAYGATLSPISVLLHRSRVIFPHLLRRAPLDEVSEAWQVSPISGRHPTVENVMNALVLPLPRLGLH